ncbi:MAG TPA: hypothetical protein VF179_08735, partial [Thermoanaerobaculia bacterium]|nr:hypothetical protein [Thermoanaerobaculia bacterium]
MPTQSEQPLSALRSPGIYKLLAVAVAMMLLLGAHASQAGAMAPPLFTQIPEDGSSGSAAGQFSNPRAIATDDATGHIYVAEVGNRRISEFTAWGEF